MPPELISAMPLAPQPQYRSQGSLFEQALGWIVLSAESGRGLQRIVIKDGGTAGFSCTLLVNHSKDLAVFIMANKSQIPAQRLGVEIVRHIP